MQIQAKGEIDMLTSMRKSEDREQTLARGMNEHIAKPFDVRAFLDILHGYISKEE